MYRELADPNLILELHSTDGAISRTGNFTLHEAIRAIRQWTGVSRNAEQPFSSNHLIR